ncbi:MAG: hypothetical protein A3F18_03185 [Legionellales bacterium RIFCSPHIGHO2_12_FULL_37_14]|nr:MAG: hypothetical protein A3F18_03185 [Legionellales bacterium RIFCSPHIGHO2_12_FULL_37_14]
MKRIKLYLLIFLISNFAHAGLTQFGNVMQIVNPTIAGLTSTQEKGMGHFLIVFAQVEILTQAMKFIGEQTTWQASQRPCCLSNYGGMPSGHTAAAWSGASYVRLFSPKYPYLIVPLYATSVATAYSRVQNKQHSSAQVITAAALTEILTVINSSLNWSKNYQAQFSLAYTDTSKDIKFAIKF